MTIAELRAIAAWHHRHAAALDRKIGKAMLKNRKPQKLYDESLWHTTVGEELTKLADSFSAFSTLLIQP